MSQEVKRIKAEDKKAFKKFLLCMLIAMAAGVASGIITSILKDGGVEKINQFLWDVAVLVLPYGIPVVTVIVMVAVMIIYGKSCRIFREWDGEEEEEMDRVETWLSYALWLVNISIIWAYFVFGVVSCLNCWEQMEILGGIDSVLWMMIWFILSMVVTLIGQQKVVNLEKEINPEKVGSVYDPKFQKKWEGSCDEAELLLIYKSAYKAYYVTNRLCIGLWVFCVIGGFIWNWGVVPVFIVTLIWAVMLTVYTFESIRLSKNGGR